jgi:uncharacterized membrane protein YphA (DoxX/SURF4 family)
MKYTVLVGRLLFSVLFIISAFGKFSAESAGYAAAKGVPAAAFLVPAAGILELLGGLSVLLGYRARWGAWCLVAFLLPVTFAMHGFWNEADPTAALHDMVHFMKNLSLLGAALLIGYFGSGPFSLDSAIGKKRAAQTH